MTASLLPTDVKILLQNPEIRLALQTISNELNESVDLMIAGHTHGGQINIPGLTCVIFRSMCLGARYGLAQTRRGQVFVTSGTGMVGLPLRFNTAPRVDVIDLSWRALRLRPRTCLARKIFAKIFILNVSLHGGRETA